MFCRNCGRELSESVVFCPVCGTKRSETSAENDSVQTADRYTGENTDSQDQKTDENVGQNMISKAWNGSLFTKIAIKFGNVLEILEGIFFVILSVILFREKGFWGYAFGLLFVFAGIGCCVNGVMLLISRKHSEASPPTEAEIRKKKRNLCIGVVVMVIALIVCINTGGGTYAIVKSVSFESIGKETIGEIVNENIKSPEWTQTKLDNDSRLVYVKGYCPAYGETIQIEFYYEKLKDGSHEVSLNGISCPDSDEEYGTLEAAIIWASFYD